MRQLEPSLTLSTHRPFFHRPLDREKFVEGFRLAGLPE
jgi:hypothetical protein